MIIRKILIFVIWLVFLVVCRWLLLKYVGIVIIVFVIVLLRKLVVLLYNLWSIWVEIFLVVNCFLSVGYLIFILSVLLIIEYGIFLDLLFILFILWLMKCLIEKKVFLGFMIFCCFVICLIKWLLVFVYVIIEGVVRSFLVFVIIVGELFFIVVICGIKNICW